MLCWHVCDFSRVLDGLFAGFDMTATFFGNYSAQHFFHSQLSVRQCISLCLAAAPVLQLTGIVAECNMQIVVVEITNIVAT